MKRYLIALAVAVGLLALAPESEAGFFRRRQQQAYCHPVYYYPTYCYPVVPCVPDVTGNQTTNNQTNGQTTDNQTAVDVKVSALLTFDTDDRTKGKGGIKVTGKTVRDAFDRYCGPAYRTSPGSKVIELMREGGPTPADFLAAVKAIEATEKDVIFLYVCCHGAMIDNEHTLFVGDPDDQTGGLKRSEVIAALKAKKAHAVVFITDACAEAVEKEPRSFEPPGASAADVSAVLPRLFGTLKKGTFLDINACSRERREIAGLSQARGSAASQGLEKALMAAPKQWAEFESKWGAETSKAFRTIRTGALATNPEDPKFKKQADQTLDVKRLDP